MKTGVKVTKKAARATSVRQEPEATQLGSLQKPLRPSQCRAYMRNALAQEFRGIVDGFVQGAKSGSCQHVKLATELLETKRDAKEPMQAGRRTLKRLVRRLEEIQD